MSVGDRAELEQAFIDLHESALGIEPTYRLDLLIDQIRQEIVKLIALMDEVTLTKKSQ